MKTAIQVLAHPTYDNGRPSIMLQSRAGTKYIIGQFSEGFQRVLNQHKIKLHKMHDIFLTGTVDWDSVGGLPGFLLTFGGAKRDITVQSATVDLAPVKLSWRHFIYHEGLNVDIRNSHCVFQDEYVAIEGVVCKADGEALEPSSSYIVQVLPSRGQFLVKKAIELGVPKGFMFRELTEGKTVVTPKGVTVHPHQVMDDPKTPPRVLVIDCPSNEYVNGVVNFPWDKSISRKRKYENDDDMDASDASVSSTSSEPYAIDVKVVYHFLGESMNPFEGEYFDFIMKFSKQNVLQYICHPLYCPNGIALDSFATLHGKLRKIFPDNFKPLYVEEAKKQLPGLPSEIRLLNTSDITVLEPECRHEGGVSTTDSTDSNTDSTYSITTNNLSYINEPQVITLGTGSSQPSKYRNVSSSIVRVPLDGSIKTVMFDAGEGTLGSIKRMFGPDGTIQLLRELDIIYISHLHADHHLGAVSVLNEWVKVNDSHRQLLLLAPGPFKLFLDEWGLFEENVKQSLDQGRIQFVDNKAFLIKSPDTDTETGDLTSEQEKLLSGLFIQTCPAYHCVLSYCVSILFRSNNFKVSYSGDTRPNMNFAKRIGNDSDLLIHEATHENELAAEAKAKRHSTIGEAISVSKAMNAKATILTHFSQRYPKLPELGDVDVDCALAFDGMQAGLGDISKQLTKSDELKLVFAETEAKEEEESKKNAKKLKNKEKE